MRLCPLDILVEPHQRQEVQFGRLDLVAENFVVENFVVGNLVAENLVAANPIAVNPF